MKTGKRTRNEGDRAKSPIGPVCGVAPRQPPPNGSGARSARSSRHRPVPVAERSSRFTRRRVESDKQEQRSAAGRALAGAGRKSDDEPAFRRSRLLTRGKCAARARARNDCAGAGRYARAVYYHHLAHGALQILRRPRQRRRSKRGYKLLFVFTGARSPGSSSRSAVSAISTWTEKHGPHLSATTARYRPRLASP